MPRLCLLAKSPQAGRVKTRLAQQCDPHTATELARIFIDLTLKNCVKYWPGEVVLHVWPDDTHFEIRKLKKRYGVSTVTQVSGNLGDKMLSALRHGVRDCGSAAVMGCDVPQCSGEILIKTAAALHHGKNVFGSANDGGFYLLGVCRTHDNMFDDIVWGKNTVAENTIHQCKQHGIEFNTILPTLTDIDTADDLKSVIAEFPEIGKDVSHFMTKFVSA